MLLHYFTCSVKETNTYQVSIIDCEDWDTYEEPGEEAHDVNELNFVFNDIANIGFAARSIQY